MVKVPLTNNAEYRITFFCPTLTASSDKVNVAKSMVDLSDCFNHELTLFKHKLQLISDLRNGLFKPVKAMLLKTQFSPSTIIFSISLDNIYMYQQLKNNVQ